MSLAATPTSKHAHSSKTSTRVRPTTVSSGSRRWPAGKRLVVTHGAVRFLAASGFGVPYLERGPDVVETSTTLPLPAATVLSTVASAGASVAVMSAPVTWYAEAGTTPTLLLTGPNASVRFSLPSLATISGYLIHLP